MIGGSAFFRVRLELSKYYRQVLRLVGLDFSTEFRIRGVESLLFRVERLLDTETHVLGGLGFQGLGFG